MVHVVGAEDGPHELLEEVSGLVGDGGRPDPTHAMGSALLPDFPQPLADQIQGLVPGCRSEFAILADQRLGDPFRAIHVLVGEAALVAKPLVVDGRVSPSADAAQVVRLDVQGDVASQTAIGTDAGHPFQFPGAGPEAEDAAGQGSHGADVNGVAGEYGIESLAGESVYPGEPAPFEVIQLEVVGPFFQVAHAAPAQHTAFLILDDQGAEGVGLAFVAFLLDVAALGGSPFEDEILKVTLTAFVTDRTVKGVIGEEEFQDGLAGLEHLRAGGAHHHLWPYHSGAGRLQAAHLLDLHQADPAPTEGG